MWEIQKTLLPVGEPLEDGRIEEQESDRFSAPLELLNDGVFVGSEDRSVMLENRPYSLK